MVKYWCNLLSLNLSNELSTQMGTFGVIILDARQTMSNMMVDCRKLMKREKNEIGFVIYKGDITSGKIVKEFITSKYKKYKKGQYLLEDY